MDFTLCKKAGLKTRWIKKEGGDSMMIEAYEVERMLSEAPEVFGQIEAEGFANYWSDSMLAQEKGKRKGRLVMIEEIKREPLKRSYETVL